MLEAETIRIKAQDRGINVSKARAEVMALMSDGRWRTNSDVADKLGMTYGAVRHHLAVLAEMNVLRVKSRSRLNMYVANISPEAKP